MTRKRAAAILIQNNAIALIERYRPNRHYFVFPGGGVEPKESPQDAVIREIEEELGLQIVVRRLVAEIWYRSVPQYYFLVDAIGGEFGSGQGEEYAEDQPTEYGSYNPVWMPVDDIISQPVLPSVVAEFVARSHPRDWPAKPLRLYDIPSD